MLAHSVMCATAFYEQVHECGSVSGGEPPGGLYFECLWTPYTFLLLCTISGILSLIFRNTLMRTRNESSDENKV